MLLVQFMCTIGEIDSAVLRRFQRHVHVPLPDEANRKELWRILLAKQTVTLTNEEECVCKLRDAMLTTHAVTNQDSHLAQQSAGLSGSDLRTVINEAMMAPMRELINVRVSTQVVQ